jgi:hypothetical protein
MSRVELKMWHLQEGHDAVGVAVTRHKGQGFHPRAPVLQEPSVMKWCPQRGRATPNGRRHYHHWPCQWSLSPGWAPGQPHTTRRGSSTLPTTSAAPMSEEARCNSKPHHGAKSKHLHHPSPTIMVTSAQRPQRGREGAPTSSPSQLSLARSTPRCRKVGCVYTMVDVLQWAPRVVYMRVQSLGGQGTSVDTYGSPGFYPNLPSIL